MSYIVYARKWRPQKFDDVVAQEHITTTLKNSIKLNRIAHAYIFAGPRGIGKTSTARIFAKALNCEKGPTPIPCNECTPCKEITGGNSMDVLEIDGASNRGIEQIRNLRENVKFIPSGGKYKIYIIDEVHMLTPEAFNALLKTLEEPPPHVKFIFATTRPEKVLPTILSRCQRFDFRRIPEIKIVETLKDICEKEKVKIEENALYTIAKASDGSLRDAESTLDQLVSLYQRKIESEDVTKLLGMVPQEIIFNFVNNIKEGNTSDAIRLINDLVIEGKDIAKFTNDLCEHFRNMLIVKVGAGNKELLPLSESYVERIEEQADYFLKQQLFYIINVLLETYSKMRYASVPKIPLELAVTKFSQIDKVIEVDEILNKFEELKNNNSSNLRNKSSNNKINSENFSKKEHNSKIYTEREFVNGKEKNEVKERAPEYDSKASFKLKYFKQKWPEIVERIKSKNMSLGTYLEEGKLLDLKDNNLVLGFPKKFSFHKKILGKIENKKIIEKMFRKIFGRNILLKLRDITGDKSSWEKKKNSGESILKEEMVQVAIDIFNGEIVYSGKVKNKSGESE